MAAHSSEVVVTFLESVGQRQDAEYYLRLFKQHPKQSFAVIAADRGVFSQALGAVVEPLHFLAELGLHTVLALGWFGSDDPAPSDVQQQLQAAGLSASTVNLTSKGAQSHVRDVLKSGCTAVVDLRKASDNAESSEQRTARLSTLLETLASRKLVVLRSRGGLGPHRAGVLKLSEGHMLRTRENGISVVNLTTDLVSLNSTGELHDGEQALLDTIKTIHRQVPSLMTNITSPFNVLQELFTVKGAGTLVKTGTNIRRYDRYADLDQPRLHKLLDQTFGRRLLPSFFQSLPLHIYVEQDYRGAAITQNGLGATFLTKFAVNRQARGEGMGRDLWEAMLRDHKALYWRARASNPIAGWYALQCEGMQRIGSWVVYWRGIPTTRIGEIVEDAMQRPRDFEPRPESMPPPGKNPA